MENMRNALFITFVVMVIMMLIAFAVMGMKIAFPAKIGKKKPIPIPTDRHEQEWSQHAARIARKQNPHN